MTVAQAQPQVLSQTTPEQTPSHTRLLQFKVAYWGPGESGKTTNYLWIKRKLGHCKASRGFSIQTAQKRTLWADAVWLRTEQTVGAEKLVIMWQVVTATGQERFLSTREFVLAGADGVVFVADATPHREDDNLRSFKELLALTARAQIPIIVQLNKTDKPGAIPPATLAKLLGIPEREIFPAVAIRGEGVLEVFQTITGEVFKAFFRKS
ncbi:MAG: ARF/SAR superfamily protein [Promethearchaeota archaeon CR_4]|nr:MAG: ARF/SAR superfamily protein [Candidatus Lokiarchaeota archaeon CR_4]